MTCPRSPRKADRTGISLGSFSCAYISLSALVHVPRLCWHKQCVSGGSKPSPPCWRDKDEEAVAIPCANAPSRECQRASGRPAAPLRAPHTDPLHLGSLRLGESVGPSQTPKPFRRPFPSFPSESGPVSPVGKSVDGEMETQQDSGHRVTCFSHPLMQVPNTPLPSAE